MFTLPERTVANNLRLYPWYQAASNFLPWLPVFFLFFNQFVSLSEALRLGAIYYLAVFFLEVPSGYLADRFGRRATLLLSGLLMVLACVVFLYADSFALLLTAQVFLAGGIAFQSGSDSALLYDSLVVLSREDEYSDKEAQSQFFRMIALAASSLLGGFSGSLHLSLPYAVAVIAAVLATLLAWQLAEPGQPAPDSATRAGSLSAGSPPRQAASFVDQMIACMRYLSDRVILWLTAFYLVMYTLAHVPYEFYQPYIRLLDADFLQQYLTADSAPLVAGIVTAVSMSGGAVAARISSALMKRYKLSTILLSGVGCLCIIIAGMSLVLHPLMLILISLRGFPMSLVHGPMMGAVTPRLKTEHRATFLSLQSLIGRLGFSVLMFGLSELSSSSPALAWTSLSMLLFLCTILAFGALVLLASTAKVLKS